LKNHTEISATETLVATGDKNADFVELFFDLVFVFAITKITHLTAKHLDVTHVLRSIVIFWLIWWAWTQFTWTLNVSNTRNAAVRMITLVATAVAFIMATATDRAFGPGVMWFALPYIVIKGLGFALQLLVTGSEDGQRAAVAGFVTLSLTGLAAVLGGAFVDPSYRVFWWIAATILDLTAGFIAGRSQGWRIHAKHFSERHGLIIIIALGESLIVAASAIAAERIDSNLIISGGLAVVLTCLLWWSYFSWIREHLEEILETKTGPEKAQFGRDAYSFLHFLLVCGIIGIAIGFEKVLGHPHDPLTVPVALALWGGIVLFVGCTAATVWRASGTILVPRFAILAVSTIGFIFTVGKTPSLGLGVAVAGIVGIVIVEWTRCRHSAS
jgi:low temperature requirement protein LtrA